MHSQYITGRGSIYSMDITELDKAPSENNRYVGAPSNAVAIEGSYLAKVTFLSTVFQCTSSTGFDVLECTGDCLV